MNENSKSDLSVDLNLFQTKVAKWGTIVGVALILLGIASLAFPFVTALAIEIWFGITFLLVGTILLTQAWQNRGHSSVAFEMIWGLIYLIGGGVMLLMPLDGIMTMALILGTVFVLDGIGRFALAAKAFATQRRGLWLFDGSISILLGGLILWNWPGDSAWIIGVLVGIRLLLAGLVAILVSNLIRRAA